MTELQATELLALTGKLYLAARVLVFLGAVNFGALVLLASGGGGGWKADQAADRGERLQLRQG